MAPPARHPNPLRSTLVNSLHHVARAAGPVDELRAHLAVCTPNPLVEDKSLTHT